MSTDATAERLRTWWWHRQGLDGSLDGAAPAAVLARAGWARSVGGAGPYLTWFARAGTGRAAADAAVAALAVHELPAARGCTYVLPAADFALGLALARLAGDGDLRAAYKLGVTEAEVARLCDGVLAALDAAGGPLDPADLRDRVGDLARSLGEEGRKKGVSTTLPLALGELQAAGEIRRVPVDGRLDRQRYRYARWSPPAGAAADDGPPHTALARRFFAWIGPATLAEWQWFSGLSARAARDAAAQLGLTAADGAGEGRLLLPDDVAAWRDAGPAAGVRYAFVSSLDAMLAARRDLVALLDPADRERAVPVDGGRERCVGELADLPSHAILERGRLVGLWEFDAERGEVAWATFGPPADAALLEAAAARAERWVRDDLGDARSFSLDSPKSRAPRVAALRRMRGA